MNDIKNIGIIGLGGIAHMAHLKAFSQLESCNICACCDIDADKLKSVEDEYKINNSYLDYRDMLINEKLDAVIIGTPNDSHKDISIFALEHDVNVLCEKPVALNYSEAVEIQDAVARTGNKFMVGQCFRFKNQTAKILELINNKELGDINYCKASYLRQRGIPGFGTWFTNKERAGGGVVLDLGVHMIDYIWFLLGKPAFKTVSAHTCGDIGKKYAAGEKVGFKGSSYPSTYTGAEKNIFDVDEMASIFIRFDNDITFQLEVSWAMNIESDSGVGTIFGSDASVSLNPIIFTHVKDDSVISEEIPCENVPSHDNQAREFIKFINGEIKNPAPIEDAVQVMKILDAVYKSATEKREIEISN
jgi:predicted dehydrogenase